MSSRGCRPSDPAFEPYLALAEELDVPDRVTLPYFSSRTKRSPTPALAARSGWESCSSLRRCFTEELKEVAIFYTRSGIENYLKKN